MMEKPIPDLRIENDETFLGKKLELGLREDLVTRTVCFAWIRIVWLIQTTSGTIHTGYGGVGEFGTCPLQRD